ncbi:alpha/beta hydrolase [Roseibium sp. CAU 1637]|uniref:Alpha/beta hydrolase n=1 Tax=Roseibium limicola TaxID=2816037 RepID=A0A939J6Z9_9HYPH|nr:alpha/beta hydrolase [Roseibium limicola]MBO0345637.1 alpha/beta hydrolase [Roseibium limicola]
MPPHEGTPSHLMVLLHGYGGCATDLLVVARSWQTRFPSLACWIPNAPDPLPHPTLSGRQWFDLTERDPREIEIGATTAAPGLIHRIEDELHRDGLDWGELILAGFSQGAMLALQIGLRHQADTEVRDVDDHFGSASPAAILSYSGRLPAPQTLDGLNIDAPVLLVHGHDDDVVEPYHSEMAAMMLAKAGASVRLELLETLGHNIDERAIRIGADFLDNLIST